MVKLMQYVVSKIALKRRSELAELPEKRKYTKVF